MRAAHDATSRGDESTRAARRARRTSRAPPERGSDGHDPPEAPTAIGSRLASRAKLVTRGGRTHARSSQGPHACGSCHARELVTRAATIPRESGGNPSGDRRPPTEGKAERDAARETLWTRRRRARAFGSERSTGFRRDASRSAHTRPKKPTCKRSQEDPNEPVSNAPTEPDEDQTGQSRERITPPRRAPYPAPDACHRAARRRPSSRCPALPSSRRTARPCTPSCACCA